MRKIRLAALCLFATALCARDKIGAINFYGYKGLDVEAVARALPFHVGDPMTVHIKQGARDTALSVIGRPATDVQAICCDANGDRDIYIGLPGASSKPFRYNPEPRGSIRLPRELVDLQNRIDAAGDVAVKEGRAGEDDSQGYALSADPALHALELQLRDYALSHEPQLYAALESSSDPLHREYAAQALGYASQSAKQIAALVRASRDANEDVRNDATRALGCLAQKPGLAKLIPPDTFIEMMSSGIWTDRNKASFVLGSLTEGRDPKLLALLRAQALDAIVEMARWSDMGHSLVGITLFARLAGISEMVVMNAAHGPVQAMLDLLPPAR